MVTTNTSVVSGNYARICAAATAGVVALGLVAVPPHLDHASVEVRPVQFAAFVTPSAVWVSGSQTRTPAATVRAQSGATPSVSADDLDNAIALIQQVVAAVIVAPFVIAFVAFAYVLSRIESFVDGRQNASATTTFVNNPVLDESSSNTVERGARVVESPSPKWVERILSGTLIRQVSAHREAASKSARSRVALVRGHATTAISRDLSTMKSHSARKTPARDAVSNAKAVIKKVVRKVSEGAGKPVSGATRKNDRAGGGD